MEEQEEYLLQNKNKLIGRSFVARILVILLNFVTLEEMNHTKICTKKTYNHTKSIAKEDTVAYLM